MPDPSAGGGNYLLTGQFFSAGESRTIQGLIGAKGDADEERRLDMQRRIDLFEDDAGSLLKSKLTKQYEVENFTELVKTLDTSNNLCKKIITDISTIYDEPAAWKLAKDDKGAWKDLRKASNYDLVMPAVNQRTNLCNDVLLRVAVVRGKVRYHVVTPNLLRVWQNPDDPTLIDAAAYLSAMVNTTDRLPVWLYWSNGGKGALSGDKGPTYRVFDMKWNELRDAQPNPYRDVETKEPILPFATYHKNHPISHFFDQTTGHDIVEGTLMVMVMETMINHLFRADSAQIKYISGECDDLGAQVAGINRFLKFRSKDGQPVSVGQFKSQADWPGLRNVVNDKIQNLCNAYGISRGALEVDGTPASGFALKVRKEPLREMRKRQVRLYANADRELYAVTAAVWNYERTNVDGAGRPMGSAAIGKALFPLSDVDPVVTYCADEEPMTAAEEETALSLKQAHLSMGLTNVIELYQEAHPDTTEDEARAAIEENNKINKELASGTQLVVGRAQILQVLPDANADPEASGADPVGGAPQMRADGTTNKPDQAPPAP
jgi:hypothetical protein